MIIEEMLHRVFAYTCEASRVTLDEGLRGEKGEGLNSLYAVMLGLSGETKFSAELLHSDGGVKRFLITYKFGDFILVVADIAFMGGSETPQSAEQLAKWLSGVERAIKATAVLVSAEVTFGED